MSILTDREHDVLKLVAEGRSNKEISKWLEISEHTVKFHVNSCITKLRVNTRVAASIKAIKLGELELKHLSYEGVPEPERKDPRNNADHAYEAFMAMSASEWIGLNQSVLFAGGVLTPAEQQGFERALVSLKNLCLCGRVLPHSEACKFTTDPEQTQS